MPASVERLAEHLHRPLDVRLAGPAVALELGRQAPVGLRLEHLEAEVLELPLELPDAQALGQRRVDLGGLAGDALLLLDGQRAQGAHVVQPVGELDEDDADVLRHGQEHLADVLGLLLLVGPGAELGQLGDAVDEVRRPPPRSAPRRPRCEYSVSSGTSWSSAAWTASGSRPSSARIWATASGWVMYGSPDGPPLRAVRLAREPVRLARPAPGRRPG